jgi:hypothetical protein
MPHVPHAPTLHQGNAINLTRPKAPSHMLELVGMMGNEGKGLIQPRQGGIMDNLTSCMVGGMHVNSIIRTMFEILFESQVGGQFCFHFVCLFLLSLDSAQELVY